MKHFNYTILAIASLAITAAGFSAPSVADLGPTAPPIKYRLIPSRFPSRDQIVAAYADADWNLDRTGKADCSVAIQAALNAIGASGGGTMFLAAGTYRLDNPITLPPGVYLRGEIGATPDRYRYQGTILAAYAGEGQPDSKSLVSLTSCAGISDCIVWYPKQNPDAVVPYPPSVNHASNSTSVDNVVFVNSYQAYRCGYRMGGRAYVRNIRGTALAVGVEIDGLADTGRVEGVDLSPEYWAHSGLPGAPTSPNSPYRKFMRAKGIGIWERRIDWTNTADVSVDGYNKGYYTSYSQNTEDLNRGRLTVSPNGENFNYKITSCDYGVYLDCGANAGLIFTRFDIDASVAAFYVADKFDAIATILDSRLSGGVLSLESHGTGRILMRDCALRSGGVLASGVIDCVASTFAKPVIEAADTLKNASFFSDTFAIAPAIKGAGANAVHIIDQPAAPRQTYTANPIDFEAARGARAKQLFVVTDVPFNAIKDGQADCTAAFSGAIRVAKAAGGGIIFVPPGVYVISTPLTLPSGVELRGAFDGPHDANTAGSCIFVKTGKGEADGNAFLTMQPGSTVRGLNFHYPDQEMDAIVDFPFLMRGAGANVTIVDTASANVSRFIDLMSVRCDGAYVDHVEGQPIHIGIQLGGGSRDAIVSDVQLNPSNWTFSTIFNGAKAKWLDRTQRDAIVGAYTQRLQEHGEVFVLGNCTNLRFYRDFVFAGRYGLHCIAEGGKGPSGTCLELGVDGSTTAVRIDAIGDGGFPLINSQIVVTSLLVGQRHDIELGDKFSGISRFYGFNAWGGRTDCAIQVLNGTIRVDGAHIRDPGNPAFDIKDGAMTLTASCVRRDAPVLATGVARASSIRLTGNILPEVATELKWVGLDTNLFYTDAGSTRPSVAAK